MISGARITGYFSNLFSRFHTPDFSERSLADEEAPLRSELFSADQMEQHGKALAASHSVVQGRAPDQLLARLDKNETALLGVRNLLTAAVTAKLPVTPAGEWLLDNFYLIEEQIRTAKRHLPRGYSRELPRLGNTLPSMSLASAGGLIGRPRVYDMAIEIISHGDGRVDMDVLGRFMAAYQTVSVLKLGELWATPIMLRLAVIENLRRVAVRISVGRVDRNLANVWADRMMETVETEPGNLILVIADMARSEPPMGSAFVAELARRLQGRGPALVLPLNWVEQKLSASGLTIEQLVQLENQQQAADQVSVSNSIGSLRVIGAVDWREFVEAMSQVEKTLAGDPAGFYAQMDFATRDRYRHATERIARRTDRSEDEVACKAIELARAASDGVDHERRSHVGYYLVDKGLPQLEQAVRVRLSPLDRLRKLAARHPLKLYLGPVFLISLALSAALLTQAQPRWAFDWAVAGLSASVGDRISYGLLVVLGLVSLLATSQLAVALTNWLATVLATPRALSSMDFSKGIPPDARTLVVVPTLLTSAAGVESLIEALEVRFLANRDERLHFGLLTDFADADQQTLPADDALTQLAHMRIDELNAKYGPRPDRPGDDRFFLFHRARQWNAAEKIWMGYERKRGKLSALNALLRSGDVIDPARLPSDSVRAAARLSSDPVRAEPVEAHSPFDAAQQVLLGDKLRANGLQTSALRINSSDGNNADINTFSLIVGRTAILASVKYVITLDTDTQLPRDAAQQFVGAMAHPLNRPLFDPALRRVVEGYGILQPRVAISLPGTNHSRFARLYGGEPGIDPYTRVVSDVYQDVFGEGSFIGKGIYAVDAFEQSLAARFPENMILSHDLLEGCYARAGLLSHVNLFEDYPARYDTDVSRRYRWMRGDWQLAGWLLRSVPGPTGAVKEKNPLSKLSQWKLLDNLRRSLVPAALLALLVLGWTVFASAWLWTLAVIGILLIPSLCTLTLELLRKPDEVLLRQHLSAVAQSASRRLVQLAFELACLPYEAYFSLDAIVRTVWRMRVSHRHLLEWNPSLEANRAARQQTVRGGYKDLLATLRCMWIAPLVAALVALYLAIANPAVVALAEPILLLWLASPLIVWWFSRPLAQRQAALSSEQRFFLRTLTRRTWSFFERFVGEAEHWLPPDNFQEYRIAAIAHRTSPTNIGMALLANLAAYDFGYLTAGRLAQRTANTLRTMEGLERYRGHFFNWYDTQTLQALLPLYVSTVDSGNLAGHLLTLRAGLLALSDDRILPVRLLDGLGDTFRVLEESLDASFAEPHASTGDQDNSKALTNFRYALQAAAGRPPATLSEAHSVLTQLASAASDLLQRVEAGSPVPAELLTEFETARPEAAKSEAPLWAQALAEQCREARDELRFLAPWLAPSAPDDPEVVFDGVPIAHIPTLRELADAGSTRAQDRIAEIDGLALQVGEMAHMDYDFLYDRTRHLLSIGYNVGERRLDAGYYDLLASEARLSCFVAIAQGQLPQDIWFALGRLLTGGVGEPVLLSWSGSMFEYLMPLLVMPTYDNTLLDQTCRAAVARQIEYGKQRGVPWGISESGYNTVDVHLNYQYRAFGVPGLGLKRGLAQDLVIAPYATVMALMVAPEAACQNLQRMAELGFMGTFGFYEAIDYTPARQRRKQSSAVVRSFMAHHQGMSLLSLAYLLLDRPMQRRFASDREFQAVMPLLQERVPKAAVLFSFAAQLAEVHTTPVATEMPVRVFNRADTPVPEVQLLSNGRYHVMISNAGGGYSRWKDLAVTRWREDGTRDHWGSFCYIRELTRKPGLGMPPAKAFWSSAYQPTLRTPERYEAIFSEGRAEFRRRDAVDSSLIGGDSYFETHTEIVVSPEDDIELRRVRITNRTRLRREIEVTSYAEVVIAPAAEDALHPAFSNLFVQTEILRDRRAILCTRRPRSLGEAMPWMLHLVAVHGAVIGEVYYETDRARFVGRGRTTADPLAMNESEELSGSEGSVLDPIVSVRYSLTLDPDQTVTIDMVTGMADTRDIAVGLIDKYQDRRLADRVLDLAWTHSQVVLRQLNASEVDAQLHARLAGSVIYANAGLRADAATLLANRRGQSGLWGYAISGDLPIVLLQIGDANNIGLVRQLVQAHAYWRLKGLAVDLVIWNEDHAGYRQQLQDQIMGLITSGIEASVIDRPGGIFVRSAEQISGEDRVLFQSVARAVIADSRGTLEEQLEDRRVVELLPTRLMPSRALRSESLPESPSTQALPIDDLILFNGLGGFRHDGSEYVIVLPPGKSTPAPWVNVLANAQFGGVVSENGVGYTWAENAHEFRMTPWNNDPVSDASGEALYLRDEETGNFWSPTPLPVRAATTYTIRHGFGYSVFETDVGGIHSELWVYVALDASVKFSVLKLRNDSGRPRRLSATSYVEWVLGDLRAKSAMHINTEVDVRSGALLARNPYSTEFSDRLAFFDVDDRARSLTGDRREFIGRNGTLRNPAAMRRTRLSGKVGAGLDPCAAIQVSFDLANGQEHEVVFRLGLGRTADDAGKLVQRFRGAIAARAALEAVCQYWAQTLGVVRVETPDAALNVLANGWLVYQTLACRIWARSGYYQSGGAFGYRDQLQDMMALVHAKPALVREHLLLCASRQFQEGDVQHWWHPPSGRGVRTRCSDDYLWLPLAVCRYVAATGDTGVLDEAVTSLEGRAVNPEDDSYYDLPARSADAVSLYRHCVRAIEHGLRFGEHGLPLIGSGDWNDGMNLVGIGGKGESVWLGFFLSEVLRQFAPLATTYGDPSLAALCLAARQGLQAQVEEHAWDGAWYRRAWFDDGTPLGSARNVECRIDSISQSWSVLSGSGDPAHARTAMQAVDTHLVRRDNGLVQLLDPPFSTSDLNPGYIRGYVPGVRENGGQYTHAAIWATMAFAELGEGERAWELFRMINPVNHALTADAVATYKVEPYVVAADVYAVTPHTGRGGWSWYTGSAGWMYRLVIESLLGLRRDAESLSFQPCLPADWAAFRIHYRYRETMYHIAVEQATEAGESSGVASVSVDGEVRSDRRVALVDDRQEHQVVVIVKV